MIGKIALQSHAQARLAKRAKTLKYQDLGQSALCASDLGAHADVLNDGIATVTGRGNQWFYLSGPSPFAPHLAAFSDSPARLFLPAATIRDTCRPQK